MYIYLHIYTYIYIYREREREVQTIHSKEIGLKTVMARIVNIGEAAKQARKDCCAAAYFSSIHFFGIY